MFTRIVAGYNDSPRARRALSAAVRLASGGDGADLIVVAVERGLALSGDSIGEVNDADAPRERACTGWLSAALAYADERGAGRLTARFWVALMLAGGAADLLGALVVALLFDACTIGRSGRPGGPHHCGWPGPGYYRQAAYRPARTADAR